MHNLNIIKLIYLKSLILILLSGLSLNYLMRFIIEEETINFFYFTVNFIVLIVLSFFNPLKNVRIRISIALLLSLFVATVSQLYESIIQQIEIGFYPELIIEHTLRIFLPLTLIVGIYYRNKLYFLLKLIISMVFLGHGIVALGINNTPNNFHELTHVVLGFNNENSDFFLKIIGWFDVFVAFGIFTKHHLISKVSIIYMVLWGFLTAIARFIYGALIFDDIYSFLLGFSNMIFRLPNSLIPLGIVFLFESKLKNNLFWNLKLYRLKS